MIGQDSARLDIDLPTEIESLSEPPIFEGVELLVTDCVVIMTFSSQVMLNWETSTLVRKHEQYKVLELLLKAMHH